jgi:hypothetical protein
MQMRDTFDIERLFETISTTIQIIHFSMRVRQTAVAAKIHANRMNRLFFNVL